ncbi:PilN domain-containing protein [Cellulomonas carbonis]|uniref:Fimbrial assembly protein n=1 Tax=Cellulomonas carbonis T26 TaxID=947969 RepID=A0A0A0BSH7_9CELL|nr:hypothetical protein [Cellulomonas carbonis]KGM10099.1 fimbrial assembly protein [Cellulomonas carbonis T26]GGB94105.1 hypothetical protein GCM10010972_03480 [Cellulomonas carbonis]
MTATIDRATGAQAKKTPRAPKGAALVGGLPQVNLLPPEVKAARGLRVVKRMLALAVGVVALVIVLVFVWSVMQRSSAQDQLAQAQQETARLQAEEAKYAEVPQVQTQLEATRTARELGMSTEVLWKPYLDAITAVLPADVSFENVSLTSATPTEPAPLPAGPLEEPSIGRLTFTGRTATVPDVAAWVDALESVPGFADAWVTTATLDGAEAGSRYYAVTSSVQITDAALAQRFAAADAEEES